MSFWPRAILHVDMDAFYASVEQRDNPALRGKPVIVGGSAEGRGVVSAASYEARAYGVHSAMPTGKAMRLCPHAVFVSVRMRHYGEVSRQIHAVFARFTPQVQPISIDEAFLDITGCQRLLGAPEEIARALKDAVRAETELTASVGIAPTCFVAKIASDLEKPDGLVVIPEDLVLDRLAPLPIERIWGVGPVMAQKLHRLGLRTIGQLRAWPLDDLVARFGDGGRHLHDLARGIDPRPVEPGEQEKSVSHETTFARDLLDRDALENALLALSDKVATRLRRYELAGRTVQLKLRYGDFTTVTRRRTLDHPTCLARTIFETARDLLRERTDAGRRPVRLIGVGVSGFGREGVAYAQTTLFEESKPPAPSDERAERKERAADAINDKLGPGAIGRASVLLRAEHESRKKPDASSRVRPPEDGNRPRG